LRRTWRPSPLSLWSTQRPLVSAPSPWVHIHNCSAVPLCPPAPCSAGGTADWHCVLHHHQQHHSTIQAMQLAAAAAATVEELKHWGVTGRTKSMCRTLPVSQLHASLARPQPTSAGAQPACLLLRHAAGSIPHAAGGTMSKAFTPTQPLKQILAEMRPPSQGDNHDSGFTIQSTPHHLTAPVGGLYLTRIEC
jgi:hypothetical protein